MTGHLLPERLYNLAKWVDSQAEGTRRRFFDWVFERTYADPSLPGLAAVNQIGFITIGSAVVGATQLEQGAVDPLKLGDAPRGTAGAVTEGLRVVALAAPFARVVAILGEGAGVIHQRLRLGLALDFGATIPPLAPGHQGRCAWVASALAGRLSGRGAVTLEELVRLYGQGTAATPPLLNMSVDVWYLLKQLGVKYRPLYVAEPARGNTLLSFQAVVQRIRVSGDGVHILGIKPSVPSRGGDMTGHVIVAYWDKLTRSVKFILNEDYAPLMLDKAIRKLETEFDLVRPYVNAEWFMIEEASVVARTVSRVSSLLGRISVPIYMIPVITGTGIRMFGGTPSGAPEPRSKSGPR